MERDAFLRSPYAAFNAHLDGALAGMAADVDWPTGWEPERSAATRACAPHPAARFGERPSGNEGCVTETLTPGGAAMGEKDKDGAFGAGEALDKSVREAAENPDRAKRESDAEHLTEATHGVTIEDEEPAPPPVKGG